MITVASRRLIDQFRATCPPGPRDDAAAADAGAADPDPDDDAPSADDTLLLLFLCCHPALTPASQTALTLRAVGGLTTAEIAQAFLVPEATMAARISRAKQRIKAAGSRFSMPAATSWMQRLPGRPARAVPDLQRGLHRFLGHRPAPRRPGREAIRLARMVHRQLPADGEVAGLLALMLLTDSRRHTRTTPTGDLIPLADQDRASWDAGLIAEGTS